VVGLLFGQDLLSLGNSAVFDGTGISIAWLRGLFGAAGPTLVPAIETSYLTIFRTPEPQTSYAVFFVVLALLIRILKDSGDVSAGKLLAALCVGNAFLFVTYVPPSYALLLLQFTVAALLLINGRIRTGGAMCAITLVLSALMAISLLSQSEFIGTLVVESRLPIITPSVVLGVAGIVTWMVLFIKRPSSDPLSWFSLALMALPVVLCNQQILTGKMISTRQWEFYTNYPALVLGVALLIKFHGSGLADLRTAPAHSLTRWALLFCSVATLIVAQNRSYRMWEPPNLQSLAMARALAAADARLPEDATLVLDVPGLAPLLSVRRHGARNSLLDYTDVFLDRIPLLDTTDFKLTEHGKDLFVYWRLSGLSPDQARRLLENESSIRNGIYLAFLFSTSDFQSPDSDNRSVRDKEIEQLIPDIIALYSAYLEQPLTRSSNRAFVRLTERSARAIHQAIRGYQFIPLGFGEAGGVVEWAYSQDWNPNVIPPTESDIVVGGRLYHVGEVIVDLDFPKLTGWGTFKKDQSIELTPDGLVISGKQGAGLLKEFNSADLGLSPGDLIQFEVAVADTRPSDLLSIHGQIAADPKLIDNGKESPAWHGLGQATANGGVVEAIARLVGASFVVYLYSESETAMKVKYLRIRRLVPS